jgi:photosystem II stability/assembly factor-like uncharacterized protein
MRRRLLLLLAAMPLLFALALPASASATGSTGSGGWVWQNPLPQGNTLNAVDFVDTGHGWAVGDNGVILATEDGGNSWIQQTSWTTNRLEGVAFCDLNHGWVVGQAGLILETSDGGHTWLIQDSGISADLYAVAFSDSRHGWAVGQAVEDAGAGASGTILATRDGGTTWTAQAAGVINWLQSVSCADDDHAWAVGPDGVLATTNGGVTWNAQFTRSCGDVAFTDASHGWATSWGSGSFSATADAGTHWTTQNSGVSFLGRTSVATCDPNHAWVVGAYGTIAATIDGGASWSAQSSGLSTDLLGVDFVDDSHGWAVGYGGTILVTADGGAAWTRQTLGSSTGLSDVFFTDSSHGCVVGWQTILATSDGGGSWTAQNVGASTDLFGVAFSDSEHGWAVGTDLQAAQGVILATTDSGVTWHPQVSETTNVLCDTAFVDNQHGWAVGGNGTILATTNGGGTWSPLISGSSDFLVGVQFIDADHGYVVGFRPPNSSVSGGVILATSDGGQTWSEQASTDWPWLRDVVFTDGSHGWIVGQSGAILVTTDGGETWTSQASGTSADLEGVDFVDASNGWAVGYDFNANGVILATTDGGVTWTPQHPGTTGTLINVAFLDATHGWAVGGPGTILSTATGGFSTDDDSTPPTTTVFGADSLWHSAAVSLTLSASDNLGGSGMVGGHATVEYRIDSGARAVGTQITLSASVDHTGDGLHVVSYRSSDAVGNWESIKSVSVKIDTTAPVTTVSGADDTWHAVPASLSFSAGDSASGVASTSYQIDGGAWAAGTSCTVSGDGIHTVSYRSTDAAGNTESAKSDTVKIDTTAPTTTASGLDGLWHNSAVTVGLVGSDALSGPAGTSYSLDGGVAIPCTGSLTISTAGIHTLSYFSTDLAGNVETAKSATVKIDTGKPISTATKNVTVTRGKKGTLGFKITDPAPSCGTAMVTLTIKLKAKIVKTITVPNVPTNKARSNVFKVNLKKGTYTWTVKATDIAGNAGKASAAKKLTVK